MAETDVHVSLGADHVATVEVRRGPHNYFSPSSVAALADALAELDTDLRCRAVLLCSAGKNFSAGADFAGEMAEPGAAGRLYEHAVRLFTGTVPIVAAIQGAAIGGGLGLALAADFRVATPTTRFTANFARLGLHQGFGISATLPAVVGAGRAAELLYSGRDVRGEEALAIGLVDQLAPEQELRARARELAVTFTGSAPMAIRAIRATLRRRVAEQVAVAVGHELAEQDRLRRTHDFREGIAASSQRRSPEFTGT